MTVIYRDDGQAVGHVEGNEFIQNRQGSKHMLRKPPSWSIDKAILVQLKDMQVTGVRITDQETGITYLAGLSDFDTKAKDINWGYGAQRALPLENWSKLTPGAH